MSIELENNTFQVVFWKFIKEKVGIKRIIPTPTHAKYKTKVPMITEKIAIMLQKSDFDDDKLEGQDSELLEWSQNAVELANTVKHLGVISELCVEEYILSLFAELSVQRQGVTSFDTTVAKFQNLKVLNLSFNSLTRVDFLPPNIEELYLNGNQINEISLNTNKPFPTMIHLGISMNRIRQTALVQIVKLFPNLFSFDISFNDLCDMENAIVWCNQLDKLKMLFLEGNPLVLTNHYKQVIIERIPTLKVLDGSPVFVDQTVIDAQAEKLKKVKTMMLKSSRSLRSTGTMVDVYATAIESNVTLDVQLRCLKGIEGGRYLIPDENCTIEVEKLDEIDEEHKSSQYWFTYRDHENNEVVSDKKTYIKHFQVEENDAQKQIGKTDMDFKLRIEERPSVELRDWLYNDILVYFHESRPKFEKFKEEGSEVETDRVVMDEETGLPVVEHLNRGLMKINLGHWLKKSPLNPKYDASQKKQAAPTDAEAIDTDIYHQYMFFYPEEWLVTPEFRYENRMDQLKPKDVAMLEAYLKEKEEKEAAKKAEEEAAANAGAGAPGGKKADPKKDAKKAPAKGAAVVEDKNSPQQITVDYPETESTKDYMIFERDFLAVDSVKKKKVQGGADERQRELIKKYKIIRGSPFSLAVKFKLNKEEESNEVEVEEPEEVPVDPKAKGKK